MATTWDEVSKAREQNRHELVLTGPEVAARIEDGGLDDRIFDLGDLNFLEISRAHLTIVPDRLAQLSNLTNLVLHNNSLTTLNANVGELKKLKLLDVSFNKLEALPEEITQLTDIYRLNVNGNQLTCFPDISGLSQLHELDISHNQLEALPPGITSNNLALLTQIRAEGNQISEIPVGIPNLQVLKVFNIADNKLTAIPADISECGKLREFNFSGNKYKDRRLQKMMTGSSCKSVLDYLRGILEKERQSQGDGKSKGKKGKKSKGKGAQDTKDEVDDLTQDIINIMRLPQDYDGVTIQTTTEVQGVRPYIVCAIVRNLSMKGSTNMFKRFISLQTKLHDGICQKRVAATIATHDLTMVKHPLRYEARKPSQMKLIPLFKQREVSAEKLVAKLRLEADELRKEKKRNTFSGIHKYLDLIHGKPLYPCLVDKDGVIISFPPITNCDSTKISADTTDILIEVTSSSGLEVCKQVLDELLRGMLDMGLGGHAEQSEAGAEAEASSLGKRLIVEQVKTLGSEGVLKVVYPSRTDLQGEGFKVIREYDV